MSQCTSQEAGAVLQKAEPLKEGVRRELGLGAGGAGIGGMQNPSSLQNEKKTIKSAWGMNIPLEKQQQQQKRQFGGGPCSSPIITLCWALVGQSLSATG